MSFNLPSLIPSPFIVTRQTGRLDASDLSTTGGNVPGGRSFMSETAKIGDGCRVDIGVGVGLKINANDADAVERSRFDVVDAAGEGEEALQVIGDVAFDLLRRHSRVERRHDDHRNVHRREHVHRHSRDAAHAQNQDDQAGNDDEIRRANGKAGHG